MTFAHNAAATNPGVQIDTFVIIHDQDLVIACEEEGRFSDLPDYKYIFVGSRDASRLELLDNVIVARDLQHNIEDYPNLVSFTGWFAVARNRLASAPWVALLEYDVRLTPDFVTETLTRLRTKPCLVGYVPFPLSHPMYLHATPWLIPGLQSAHSIDVARIIGDHLDAGGRDEWTATTNASMSTLALASFVDWFEPVSWIIRHDPIGAHVHERTLPIFCILNGLENSVLPDVLKHLQQRSHGIFARSWDEAEQEAERLGGLGGLTGSS